MFQHIDEWLFYAVNHGWANPFFDKIFPFITHVDSWLLLYLAGFYILLFRTGTHGRIAAIALALTILATDQLNSSVLKELFGRIRPCHTLEHVRLLVDCGGGKSMPSSHAANNFAAALVLTIFFRRERFLFFGIATSMALSRVYIGVHYPADILLGAAVGLIIATIVTFATTRVAARYFPVYPNTSYDSRLKSRHRP